MSVLPAEPRIDAATVQELRALSAALSRQATDLYERLAQRMAEFRRADAEDAFRQLSQREREAAPHEAPSSAVLPDALTDEDLGTSRYVTPYAAYALAVRNAERVFALWTYAGAHTGDPAIRAEAERLARASSDRAKNLRVARRQAFHRERQSGGRRELWAAGTLGEFRQRAGESEAALAALHSWVADTLAQAGDGRAAALAGIARQEAGNARRLGAVPRESDRLPADAPAQWALALERLEAAAENYLAAAEASRDEAVMTLAQELAESAIARLAALR